MQTLSPISTDVILHFGEMGRHWGVSRSAGQIYALLFISNRPMHADEITESLAHSRANTGIGIKELQSWKMIRLQHLPGDRRHYYTVPQDVWDIFGSLAEERRRRKVEPTMALLRQSLQREPTGLSDQIAQQSMQEMHTMMQQLTD